jgi:hypothetical protein
MMTSSERRREARLPFRADCRIEIVAPPDYANAGLMQGRTVNITEHGLMVLIPGIRKDVLERWQKAVDQEKIILVQAILISHPGAPPLKGQIVWTSWKDDPEEGAIAGLGLLFQILSDRELESLREILAGLSTQSDV